MVSTPGKLNILDSKCSILCWRCGQDVGVISICDWSVNHYFWSWYLKKWKSCKGYTRSRPQNCIICFWQKAVGLSKKRVLITNMVTAARLMIVKNWKSNHMFQLSELYDGVLEVVIIDTLTCVIWLQKELLKENNFVDMWQDVFCTFYCLKGKAKCPNKI